MLFHVGGDGSRPTFFEAAAADHLPASLRAAVLYCLGVLAQRRPALHRVLDRSDEAFALLMLLLEGHSLRTSDASFSEALYGLRRAPAEVVAAAEAGPATTAKEQADDGKAAAATHGLTRRQRLLSLFFLVGLPYMKSKMQSAYASRQAAVLRARLWEREEGAAEDGEDDIDGDAARAAAEAAGVPSASAPAIEWLKHGLGNAAAAAYPAVHVLYEGVSFAYQLLYLLDATGFYSFSLHCLQLKLRRASGQELMDATKIVNERRKRELYHLRGPPVLQRVQRGLLGAVYTTLDYAQTSLIAAVFLFKMVEWWYQSAEQRLATPAVYPPPPPPPPPKEAEGGLSPPSDRRLCPLCLQSRTNPAMVATSGFVFCYPCIFSYVQQYKRCPVTLIPSSVDNIRRLYHNA
eukprot:SM000008S22162  [mRNA]  locus=s8:169171:172336:+ [translate_table: standard]